MWACVIRQPDDSQQVLRFNSVLFQTRGPTLSPPKVYYRLSPRLNLKNSLRHFVHPLNIHFVLILSGWKVRNLASISFSATVRTLLQQSPSFRNGSVRVNCIEFRSANDLRMICVLPKFGVVRSIPLWELLSVVSLAFWKTGRKICKIIKNAASNYQIVLKFDTLVDYG